MNNYEKDKFCMSFTNEEIKEYLIKPLSKYSSLNLRLLTTDGIELVDPFYEKITFICFDGKRENFYIRFYDDSTSIFISDEERTSSPKYTFNEEFMFLDDDIRQNYTSSDTSGNVVYGGTLKNRTHEELLMLFCEIIVLLNGARSISIEEQFVSQNGFEYPKYNYNVKIYKESSLPQNIKYENISFTIINAV